MSLNKETREFLYIKHRKFEKTLSICFLKQINVQTKFLKPIYKETESITDQRKRSMRNITVFKLKYNETYLPEILNKKVYRFNVVFMK